MIPAQLESETRGTRSEPISAFATELEESFTADWNGTQNPELSTASLCGWFTTDGYLCRYANQLASSNVVNLNALAKEAQGGPNENIVTPVSGSGAVGPASGALNGTGSPLGATTMTM
jgi:hypothetical protein